MKPPTRSWLRLVATVMVATAGTASAEIETVPSPERPKVEYVEVKGQRCLEPVVNTDDAQVSDYRAAARRWLAKKYPARVAPRWETVIILSPQQGTDEREKTIKRETAHVQAFGRLPIEVCFDINLTERNREQSPRRPSIRRWPALI